MVCIYFAGIDLGSTMTKVVVVDKDEEVCAESRASEQILRESVSLGMSPQQVADCVFTAIREGKFYIITDSEQWKPWVQRRMEDILQERNPTNPFQS